MYVELRSQSELARSSRPTTVLTIDDIAQYRIISTRYNHQ